MEQYRNDQGEVEWSSETAVGAATTSGIHETGRPHPQEGNRPDYRSDRYLRKGTGYNG